MNVDEAIQKMDDNIAFDERYGCGNFDEVIEAWRVIQEHLAKKVDDAMVERAYKTFSERLFTGWDEKEAIRLALIAALGVEGPLEGIRQYRGNPESPPCT